MKFKNLIIIIAVIYLGYRVIFLINSGLSYSPARKISEPSDYSELLIKTNSKLKYLYTKTKENSLPISLYTYDNSKYAIAIFKKKTKLSDLPNNINFIKQIKTTDANKFYSVFMSERFKFLFGKKEIVNHLDVFIDNFSQENIIKKSKNEIHLSFSIKNSFAISLDKKNINIQSEALNTNEEENNELILLLKNDFIYFIYSKPLKKTKDNSFNLKEIINF